MPITQQPPRTLLRVGVLVPGQIRGQTGVAGHNRLTRTSGYPDQQVDGAVSPVALGIVDGQLGLADPAQARQHAGPRRPLRGQDNSVPVVQHTLDQPGSVTVLERVGRNGTTPNRYGRATTGRGGWL
jgi:hypothetical protein